MPSKKASLAKHPDRRRWSVEQKLEIMAETLEPGVSVAAVARRHEMNANLLFTWLREAGRGRGRSAGPKRAEEAVEFVSLGTLVRDGTSGEATLRLPAPIGSSSSLRRSLEHEASGGRIEIDLPGGARVRVKGPVDESALRHVLEILKDLS